MQADGPLTGAPLNFPTPPGGPCCPPVLAGQVGAPTAVFTQNVALVVPILGVKLDNIVSVEVREAPGFPPPVALPIFTSIGALVPGVPPAYDTLPVTLDSSAAEGFFTLLLTNDCGCCAIYLAEVTAA